MCFHNSLSVDSQTLENRYLAKFEKGLSFLPVKHGNAFANINWPVITNANYENISMLNWGLIPSWVKDEETAKKIRIQTLNARSETVFEKPSFKKSINEKRCLVPSTGFYEWQHVGKNKIPWFIGLKNTEVFSLAGIWDEWTNNETGEIVNTFSILTTRANEVMEKIHNTKKRMPVMLLPERENDWLNGGDAEEINSFFNPILSEKLFTTQLANLR